MSHHILHTRKSNREPNEIIIYDDYAEVILYNNKNIECARAKFSLDKIDIVKQYKWCAYLRERSSYAVTASKGSTKRMHNILFDVPKEMIIDHINRNGLDNRNENIRFCTPLDNSRNVGPKKNNKSGVAGVYWNSANENWRTRIKVNGKSIEIGSFEDIEEAKKARIEAEKHYYGEFAPQDEQK